MFSSRWLPDLFAQAFAKLPDDPIWRFAEREVYLRSKQASEEGYYQSKKTPWTRDMQDLVRKPWRNGRRVRRFGSKKSSQSGYTEAILNCIRWEAKHRPRNVIYSIDSLKEVNNIRERLVSTLQALGQEIFTGNEDDLAKFVLKLRGMYIWFTGSFAPGGFANKFAPRVYNDEVDLYGEISEQGDTIENYWSRAKTADDGFQAIISKPAMEGGPIDTFFSRGNQEEWMVPCPHCYSYQFFEIDRLIFNHCKDLTGHWDMQRMLVETFYRCRCCGGKILNHHKPWLNERGVWSATAKGDPEIVTQHISDLYSMYEGSSFGHIAKEFVTATTLDNRNLLQTFWQDRLGKGWKERIQKVEENDVLKLRKPYRRGIIPKSKCILVLGMDIGLYTNTKWAVYAFTRDGSMWLIDWGTGDGPMAAIFIMRNKRYECPETGEKQAIYFGFIDARYRRDEVYETCMLAPRQIFPVMGLKSDVAARSISYHQVPGKPPGFGVLAFVDRDAKFDLYIDRIKEQKPPPIFWPEDVDDTFVREHCAERLIRHRKTNKVIWEEEHKRPNHYGDATKIALTGVDWLIGGKRSRMLADLAANPEKPLDAPAPAKPEGELPAELAAVV